MMTTPPKQPDRAPWDHHHFNSTKPFSLITARKRRPLKMVGNSLITPRQCGVGEKA